MSCCGGYFPAALSPTWVLCELGCAQDAWRQESHVPGGVRLILSSLGVGVCVSFAINSKK
jgi:hypothetical protein